MFAIQLLTFCQSIGILVNYIPDGDRMKEKPMSGYLSVAAGLACLAISGAVHAFPFIHNETVTNNTGTPANDITLDLIRPALQLPRGAVSIAASTFAGGTACCVGATMVTITSPGPTVPNGGSMNVGWVSAAASDLLLNTSFWTFNGANIGPVTTNNAISLNETHNPDGTVTVAVNNMSGAPQPYTSLAIDNGAPIADFNAAVAETDMGLGTPVTPLIPTSGTLPTGITTLATFTPSSTGYEGEAITIDGLTTFLGDSLAIPEPVTWATLILGLFGIGAALRRRRPALERSASLP
jgi:hypothetical protein